MTTTDFRTPKRLHLAPTPLDHSSIATGYVKVPIIYTQIVLQIDENGHVNYLAVFCIKEGEQFQNLVSPTHTLDHFRNSADTIHLEANGTADGFTLKILKATFSHKFYLQAYAKNEAGMGIGQPRNLTIPKNQINWWGNAKQSEWIVLIGMVWNF